MLQFELFHWPKALFSMKKLKPPKLLETVAKAVERGCFFLCHCTLLENLYKYLEINHLSTRVNEFEMLG